MPLLELQWMLVAAVGASALHASHWFFFQCHATLGWGSRRPQLWQNVQEGVRIQAFALATRLVPPCGVFSHQAWFGSKVCKTEPSIKLSFPGCGRGSLELQEGGGKKSNTDTRALCLQDILVEGSCPHQCQSFLLIRKIFLCLLKAFPVLTQFL